MQCAKILDCIYIPSFVTDIVFVNVAQCNGPPIRLRDIRNSIHALEKRFATSACLVAIFVLESIFADSTGNSEAGQARHWFDEIA